MIEVCTVWSPKPGHSKYREDYLELMALQKRTAERFGHVHRVVTDCAMPGFDTIDSALPNSLMKALLMGIVRRLEMPVESHILFVDADCLIASNLTKAFYAPSWDLGLTARKDEKSPINNGAMYVPMNGAKAALAFFKAAHDLCADHWGGDQEAISLCASPIGEDGTIATRYGCRVCYLPIRKYAVVPKTKGHQHQSQPYVVHFKGATKDWAEEYATKFILGAA